jgi:hypothetical protein
VFNAFSTLVLANPNSVARNWKSEKSKNRSLPNMDFRYLNKNSSIFIFITTSSLIFRSLTLGIGLFHNIAPKLRKYRIPLIIINYKLIFFISKHPIKRYSLKW